MRPKVAMLAGVLLVAPLAALAQSADAQDRRSVDPRRETAARMLKRITVNFDEARLEDALRFISDYTGATFEVMWIDDCHADGLDPNTLVAANVENVPALKLLEQTLQRAYDGFDGATWQFAATGELEMGPKSRLNEQAYLKLYDIRDLLFSVEAFQDVPDLSLGQIIQGQGGGSSYTLTREDRPRGTDEEEAQRIIDLVVTYVEPDQWRDNGGDGGSISYYNGHLLVRAPDYMHRQLIGYSFWPAETEPAPKRTRYSGSPAPTEADAAESANEAAESEQP